MKKNSSGIVWGIMLIAVGVVIGGKMLDWFDFNLFFRGWWTFFIIIPAAVRFFTERGERLTALRNLIIGLLLLMAAQGFVQWRRMIPLLIALWLIITGIRLLMPGGHEKTKKAGKAPEPEPFDRRKQEERKRKRRSARENADSWYDDRRYTDGAHFQYEDEYDYNSMAEDELYEEPVNPVYEEELRQAEKASAEREPKAGGIVEDVGFQTEAEQPEPEEFPPRRGTADAGRDSRFAEGTGSGYRFTATDDPEYSGNHRENRFEWNEYANREEYRRERSRRNSGSNADRYYSGKPSQGAARRKGHCACTAVFSGKEIIYGREPFQGAMLSAVLGGITLNLEEALMYEDSTVEIHTFMGGIDIIVPQNVRVVVKSTPILGGVDNHIKRNFPMQEGIPTLFINAVCVCGGVEIK